MQAHSQGASLHAEAIGIKAKSAVWACEAFWQAYLEVDLRAWVVGSLRG